MIRLSYTLENSILCITVTDAVGETLLWTISNITKCFQESEDSIYFVNENNTQVILSSLNDEVAIVISGDDISIDSNQVPIFIDNAHAIFTAAGFWSITSLEGSISAADKAFSLSAGNFNLVSSPTFLTAQSLAPAGETYTYTILFYDDPGRSRPRPFFKNSQVLSTIPTDGETITEEEKSYLIDDAIPDERMCYVSVVLNRGTHIERTMQVHVLIPDGMGGLRNDPNLAFTLTPLTATPCSLWIGQFLVTKFTSNNILDGSIVFRLYSRARSENSFDCTGTIGSPQLAIENDLEF